MGEHLKHGLIFAVVWTVDLLMLNMVAWTGVQTAAAISNALLVPLAWFWDLIGVSGCQAIGYIVFIVLSIPVYYLFIGFTVGFFFSLLIETILTKIEERRYRKQSPKDLNNGSPG